MLDISKDNLFIIKDSHSKYGLVEVLKFYDLDGTNWIFLHKDNSSLKYIIPNRSITYNISNLEDVLSKENLFRVDLIVIESNVDILSKIKEYINLPIIIVTNYTNIEKKFDFAKFNYVYEFFTEKIDITATLQGYNYRTENNHYMVKDVLTSDISNLENVKVSKIRDKKINKIIG